MANIYHGSISRYLTERVVSILRRPIRKIRRIVRQGRPVEIDPALSALWRESQELLQRDKPMEALEQLKRAAELSETGIYSLAIKIGKGLIALGETNRGAKLIQMSERRRLGKMAWNGEAIGERTLLIDWPRGNLERDIGFGLACLSYIARVSYKTKRCIVVVEPRLTPLFRRTLKNAEVHSLSEKTAALKAEADVVTSFHFLEAVFANSNSDDSFVPMEADRSASLEFRNKYQAGASGKRLIGISWGSKVTGREAPPFADWAELLRLSPANFVSLQYGQVAPAVKKLRQLSQQEIIVDPTVDQLLDMDRFSAQVASLDAVVSINNTIAHTAGALNLPTVTILGNKFTDWHRRDTTDGAWRRRSDRYPSTVLVLKQERDWKSVMDEVRSRLNEFRPWGNRSH